MVDADLLNNTASSKAAIHRDTIKYTSYCNNNNLVLSKSL
jgi:hypothetical protein